MELHGFRIVAYSPVAGLRSLSGGIPLELAIDGIDEMPGQGVYLGTSRRFCTDLYSGLTDDEDVLLTYAFEADDLLKGDPGHGYAEITVRRARLVAVENLSRPDAEIEEMLRPTSRYGLRGL